MRGQELNLLDGPTHIRAGWPAIVAGRYQQLRDLEQGEPRQPGPGHDNTQRAGRGQATEYNDFKLGGQTWPASEREGAGNPVPAKLFDQDTWAEMQDTRQYLAWRLAGHPQGKLSCDESVLNAQLDEYTRFARSGAGPGKERRAATYSGS